ncbi:hypothetical protein O7621_24380 [Solwaraspora sp. WMMD937]|uniref:hypothetical protein n=1 Tax=Solwaraspora sp. WMMD937 TaxID=3016090 RepID=UPI00249AA83A|nr:hypothetical protein [Solwaraspora sp. WMMD937]WFE20972.1 hypothetical protein O7621_24380 [Solwaraspora sp. WMMD937]
MQPTPTPAHAGPVKPDETGTGPGPVHGTAVPTPRPALDDNPINEATTEIPMIVPKPAHRTGPSPLPPIATQLLGGDGEAAGEPAGEPTGDSADDDRDAPAAATAPTQGVAPTPAAGQSDDGQSDEQRAETDAEPVGEDSGPVEQDAAADDQDGNGDGDPAAGAADEPADTDVPADKTVEPEGTAQPDKTVELDGTDEPDGTDEADRATAAAADPDDDERSGPTAETDDDPAEDEDEDEDEETVTAHGDAGDLFYAAADDDDFDDDEDEDDEDEFDDDEDDEERAAMLTTAEETTGPAAGRDDQPAVARPARPGDVTLPPITIWTEDAADELRDEWHEIKARFVDEPEVALAQAQSLVGHTVRTLAERLLAEQVELDPHRHSETPDTESMRMALRQYREFLDRLLAI